MKISLYIKYFKVAITSIDIKLTETKIKITLYFKIVLGGKSFTKHEKYRVRLSSPPLPAENMIYESHSFDVCAPLALYLMHVCDSFASTQHQNILNYH